MKTGNLADYEQNVINANRHYMVVKSNDIIQRSRFSLSAQQQKVLLSMIAKIKPEDGASCTYTFDIKEFCQLCNIEWDNGHNYIHLKRALYDIDRQMMWIKLPDRKQQIRLRWLDRLIINEGSGEIEFSFHRDMFPYLIELKEQFTQYSLLNVLPMRSKYAIRLYELLKSYQATDKSIIINIDTLKARIDAEKYTNFKDFRLRVLEKAVEEINTYTDIKVTYEARKVDKSRSFNVIAFSVKKPTAQEESDRTHELTMRLW